MTHRTVLCSALAFVATALLSAAAQAQVFRAYLDPSGSDANPCTLPAPCRLLPAALAAVTDGGEIWMLDSGNYNTGPVAITKSVTILAIPGALGSVVAIGGNAINIATGGVTVTLRNLVIVPFPGGSALNGINVTTAAGLALENCLVAGMPLAGVIVNGATSVRVMDTTIRDNATHGLWLLNGAQATVTRSTIGGNANTGILVNGTAAATTTTADINDSSIGAGIIGVNAASTNATAVVKVSLRHSQAVRNTDSGVIAQSSAGAAVTVSASHSIIANNATGLAASNAGAIVLATGNTVNDNTVRGFFNGTGIFKSAGDNAVRNNVADSVGVITPIAAQ